MKLVDQAGRPIEKRKLMREIAGPTVTGVRSILPTWTTRGVTPDQLAAALREAETPGHGASRAYLELAERMEETYLHYLGVLGTRKRAVSGIPIRIEPADDSAEAMRDAELAKVVFSRDDIDEEIFNILDAVGKGFSVSEIIWDMSENQWMPAAIRSRLPQWFDYDHIAGRELLLRSDSDAGNNAGGWEPLEPYKMIVHQVQAKSGLPIRGGLARIAAWAWMFQAFGMKDWVRYVEAYGLPLRIGKYGSGASADDKKVLWRAVRDIAGDAAAIVPESMQLEFVTERSTTGRSEIFRDLINYLDSQISIATVGQTLTTQEGQSGSYALGQVHNLVREDIEDADGKALAGTLRKQLIIPLITLNHGPRKVYPKVIIKRERAAELGVFAEAVSKLVPAGLRIKQEEVRARLGVTAPDEDDEVLEAPSAAMPRMARSRVALAKNQPPERVDPLTKALDAIDAEDWENLAAPLVQPILDLARRDPSALMGDLAGLYPELDAQALERQLMQIVFVADALERMDDGG